MVRARRYLNNLIEQDHRAIKQRSRSMLGLKSFHTGHVLVLPAGCVAKSLTYELISKSREVAKPVSFPVPKSTWQFAR
jgi:hypothetical protein